MSKKKTPKQKLDRVIAELESRMRGERSSISIAAMEFHHGDMDSDEFETYMDEADFRLFILHDLLRIANGGE